MIARVLQRYENISDPAVMNTLLGFFAGAVSVSLVSHFLSKQVNVWQWLDGFAQNFGTEMFGAFLTFLLIEVFGRWEEGAGGKGAQNRGAEGAPYSADGEQRQRASIAGG